MNESARARSVLTDVNQTLESALAEKESEIRAQARDKAVMDERRRIMRDMHDGLGAILSGIVLKTRSKQLPYEEVPQAVQNSLDELRLIIDSLDSAGDTLAVALGAFRERAEGRLVAAGIDIDWDVDPEVAEFDVSARDVLQIYRILQEATTNIIRHSKATNASFRIRAPSENPSRIWKSAFRIMAFGIGSAHKDGKGLDSMKERARQLDAQILLEDTSPGTRVCLKFLN